MIGINAVTKQELYDALVDIRDNAYSPLNDDWIWMDERTPLGLYIDSYVQRIQATS